MITANEQAKVMYDTLKVRVAHPTKQYGVWEQQPDGKTTMKMPSGFTCDTKADFVKLCKELETMLKETPFNGTSLMSFTIDEPLGTPETGYCFYEGAYTLVFTKDIPDVIPANNAGVSNGACA